MDETTQPADAPRHTPGTISLRPSGLLATDKANVRYVAWVNPHSPDGVMTGQDRADGERLALAWNSYDAMRAALEAARHELVTLHNLTVSDGGDGDWLTDTSKVVAQIDAALGKD